MPRCAHSRTNSSSIQIRYLIFYWYWSEKGPYDPETSHEATNYVADFEPNGHGWMNWKFNGMNSAYGRRHCSCSSSDSSDIYYFWNPIERSMQMPFSNRKSSYSCTCSSTYQSYTAPTWLFTNKRWDIIYFGMISFSHTKHTTEDWIWISAHIFRRNRPSLDKDM